MMDMVGVDGHKWGDCEIVLTHSLNCTNHLNHRTVYLEQRFRCYTELTADAMNRQALREMKDIW